MIRINDVPSISPVEKVIETRIIGSRKKKDGKNKKDKESKDRGFSDILIEEIEKTQKVLRR